MKRFDAIITRYRVIRWNENLYEQINKSHAPPMNKHLIFVSDQMEIQGPCLKYGSEILRPLKFDRYYLWNVHSILTEIISNRDSS